MRILQKPKIQDSLGVIAEVVLAATYGELKSLGGAMATELGQQNVSPDTMTAALHAWATRHITPVASPPTLELSAKVTTTT
jgi:hypothetical protein